MIDPSVDVALTQAAASESATLVVQFSALPPRIFEAASNAAERLQAVETYVKARLAQLTAGDALPHGSITTHSALGQAIIQASPQILRRFVAGPLAEAADVKVMANRLISGVRSPGK